jgi:hypothetical protein
MSKQEREQGQLSAEEQVIWAEQQARYQTSHPVALDDAGQA